MARHLGIGFETAPLHHPRHPNRCEFVPARPAQIVPGGPRKSPRASRHLQAPQIVPGGPPKSPRASRHLQAPKIVPGGPRKSPRASRHLQARRGRAGVRRGRQGPGRRSKGPGALSTPRGRDLGSPGVVGSIPPEPSQSQHAMAVSPPTIYTPI